MAAPPGRLLVSREAISCHPSRIVLRRSLRHYGIVEGLVVASIHVIVVNAIHQLIRILAISRVVGPRAYIDSHKSCTCMTAKDRQTAMMNYEVGGPVKLPISMARHKYASNTLGKRHLRKRSHSRVKLAHHGGDMQSGHSGDMHTESSRNSASSFEMVTISSSGFVGTWPWCLWLFSIESINALRTSSK